MLLFWTTDFGMLHRVNPAASSRPQRPGAPSPAANKAVGRALTYLKTYRLESGAALLSLLLVTISNLFAPFFIQLAVDSGIGKQDWNVVLIAVGGLIGAALLRSLFTFLQGYLSERASQGVAFDMRESLFAKLQRLGFSYYDQAQTGNLVTRLTSDVEAVRGFIGAGIIQIVAALLTLIGTIGVLFSKNWVLTLIVLLTIPPIFFLLFKFVSQIGPLFGQVQMALGKLNTVLQEDLRGLKVVRAFAREAFEQQRYQKANTALLEKNLSTIGAISGVFPNVILFGSLGTLATVWYGGLEVFAGRLTLGELLAFNAYLAFLLQPIFTIGFLAAGLARAGASAERIFEVLDAPLDVLEKPNATILPPLVGRVQFENVSFRYVGAEKEALKNISFAVEAGQVVAIIGGTGSGKSSLTNLIPRFYDVSKGKITIDGMDVREVQLSSLRGQIGVVLQEATLFSGTVRENIAYGKPEASLEEVVAAAQAAQAFEFISSLDAGFNTIVGERGVGLSGGQRQRIAIARALLLKPKMLILDDSTSAVDAQTEALIQDALDSLMRDSKRTTFVIAQRISTVRNADLIVVLDKGQLAAMGTHEHLLETSELYNDILGSQLKGSAA
jgi:ATP-binding cassette, subfamily B, multidrug efflux pump